MSAINITKEDIQYAEGILLTGSKTFGSANSERCNFIKNLKSMDLQAVPGSGKTTALMAKLLILEKYMPFKDGSGVLVISHTNAAIDEIKNRIGAYCPRLFSYPNFVGTIQSFVNDFLAKPYFLQKNEKKILFIEEEFYKRELKRKLRHCLHDSEMNIFRKVGHIKNSNPKLIDNCRFAIVNGEVILVKNINGQELKILKPKGNTKKYIDYTAIEKQDVYKYLFRLKSEVLKTGILHYDDAYFLAERYLQKRPKIKGIIQKRFNYVFIDEMQDMDNHQYEILDKLFYDDCNCSSIYQRIGDKNQAIYSGDVKLDKIWSDRNVFLLSGSYRLTKEIGTVVQPFALDSDFKIEGENVIEDGPLLPHLLIFEKGSAQCHVIQKYVDLVKLYQAEKKIPDDNKILSDRPIAAIAWRKEHEEKEKICLKDYCPGFMQDSIKPQADYDCLESFLIFFDKKEKGLKSISQNIINAILKVIRISGIKDEDRYFTKKRFFDYMMDSDKEQVLEFYDELQRNLYEWSISVIRGESSSVFVEMQGFIRKMFKTLWPGTLVNEFFLNTQINLKDIANTTETSENRFDCDRCSVNGRKIYINTIHSVKGKTHTATLYLESNNQENHGTAYESQRLSDQFLGIPFKNDRVWYKKSAKMAYVGFSRPTHFLCVAISKEHFVEIENKIDRNHWAVEYVSNSCHTK